MRKLIDHKESICSLCQCQIRENTLFAGLNEKQLEAFKDVVVISAYGKKEVIFLEGDECTGLYIIRTGRVKVVRSSPQGKEQIIRILSPGELLGFEVFSDARAYGNTAVAMEESELCYIPKGGFFDILEREPRVAAKLLISMGRELRDAYERIGQLGLLNAREKLAHLLYTLAKDYGVPENGGIRLNLRLSRLDIAELLGITQETSIRLLKSFKEEGLVEIRRKEIFIRDPERLLAAAR
ncbi:MAG: Crp/Fnr family transcriptional regulator [Thermodesulfobacteriota bacterium]